MILLGCLFGCSVNDFLNQISVFLTPSPKSLDAMRTGEKPITSLCIAQAAMESFFELSSILWTSAIAATLYMSVFLRLPAVRIQSYFKYMVLICQGVPLLLTILPGALDKFGPAGAWCWIPSNYQGWRWAQFFAPLWLAIVFNAVVYVIVIHRIKRFYRITAAVDEESARAMTNIVKRLRFYPLILVVVWIMATINRIVEEAKDEQVYALFFLQKVFSSTQGLLNAFAYGFSSGVKESIRDSISRQCPRLVKDVYADELVGNDNIQTSSSRKALRSGSSGQQEHTSLDEHSSRISDDWNSLDAGEYSSDDRLGDERKNTDIAVEMSDRSVSGGSTATRDGHLSKHTNDGGVETFNPLPAHVRGATGDGETASVETEPQHVDRSQSLR